MTTILYGRSDNTVLSYFNRGVIPITLMQEWHYVVTILYGRCVTKFRWKKWFLYTICTVYKKGNNDILCCGGDANTVRNGRWHIDSETIPLN